MSLNFWEVDDFSEFGLMCKCYEIKEGSVCTRTRLSSIFCKFIFLWIVQGTF